ncbi:MAG: HIT family protein [Verrucomicrobia bacterium]|nr:HIT family protein [Verrucomicrobiota bacterium]
MGGNEASCGFCRQSRDEARRAHPRWIAGLQVSTAMVSSNQICRGYVILSYNKGHATELFQLTPEEQRAFAEDLVRVAKAVHDTFRPHKMNYELLGNTAPHLHWHIIPRQKADPVPLQWPIWGKDYAEVKLSDEEYREIGSRIREHL